MAEKLIYSYLHTGTSLPGAGGEPLADMDIGEFIKKIVLGIVLVLAYVAMLSPLNTALAKWAANDTVFGPIAQTVIPLLIGVGILLAYIYAFVPSAREHLGFHG